VRYSCDAADGEDFAHGDCPLAIGERLMQRQTIICAITPAVLPLTSCSAVYYSVWEKLGYEKRDLLRSNVEGVREDQEDVGEQFESTLEKIRAIYGVEGGDLEKQYDRFKNEYERSVTKADELRDRISKVQEIASDLFDEWNRELEVISDPSLRRRSREQLAATKTRYQRLSAALEKTEAGLDPVLQRFQDQVLFLKHNLNAQAVGGLAAEVLSIESEVDDLIADLRDSIRQADEFIRQLPE
jgi:chromosome segregation ATPase